MQLKRCLDSHCFTKWEYLSLWSVAEDSAEASKWFFNKFSLVFRKPGKLFQVSKDLNGVGSNLYWLRMKVVTSHWNAFDTKGFSCIRYLISQVCYRFSYSVYCAYPYLVYELNHIHNIYMWQLIFLKTYFRCFCYAWTLPQAKFP